MSQPLISVIIPSYNYGHLIERALLSVINQADESIEILLIDDGSSDNTQQVVEKVIEQFPALKVYYCYQKNAGASAARNHGIELSQGEYILFLDADDALTENCLSQLKQDLQTKPKASVLLGAHISIEPSGKQKLRLPGKIVADHELNFKNYLFKKISISHGAALIKKNALENIRFDTSMLNGEDIPFFALLLANNDCLAVDYPLVQIHKHSESLRSRYNEHVDQREDIVKGVFASPVLPEVCKKYHRTYSIYRISSAFKKQYRQKNSTKARYFYYQMIQLDARMALKPNYVFKFLTSFFR